YRLFRLFLSCVFLPLLRVFLALPLVALALVLLLRTMRLVALGLRVLPVSFLRLVPAGEQRQRIGSREGLVGQADVLGGQVVDVGVLGEPAHPEVVQADDARVSGGALAKVQLAVGADGQ